MLCIVFLEGSSWRQWNDILSPCDIASSHLARRTFIGDLYKETPDPNIIGKLSGHKEGSRAFARYRDIDDDMLTDLVSKLN